MLAVENFLNICLREGRQVQCVILWTLTSYTWNELLKWNYRANKAFSNCSRHYRTPKHKKRIGYVTWSHDSSQWSVPGMSLRASHCLPSNFFTGSRKNFDGVPQQSEYTNLASTDNDERFLSNSVRFWGSQSYQIKGIVCLPNSRIFLQEVLSSQWLLARLFISRVF